MGMSGWCWDDPGGGIWLISVRYREYEGLKTAEIRAKRKSHGLDQERDWDIWSDGCEGGE